MTHYKCVGKIGNSLFGKNVKFLRKIGLWIKQKKIVFIEEYLHKKNEKLIDKLSSILRKECIPSDKTKKSLCDLFGVMSKSEGGEFEKIVEDGCMGIAKVFVYYTPHLFFTICLWLSYSSLMYPQA